MRFARRLAAWAVVATLACVSIALAQTPDPLPSWNDGPTKQAIVDFVGKVTREGAPEYVPIAERIATFDNDGTLWSEQPLYFQFMFALDQVKVLAPQHPEWQTQEPFKSVLAGDMKGVIASGQQGLAALLLATHTGMTEDQFHKAVTDWVRSARHPRFQRPYTDLTFQPMQELLAYLRARGFKTYIVSGGTIEFMRAWSERIYGIPPEQVVGTTFETKFQMSKDGVPELMREPGIDFIDDGPGKPVAIQKFIGRRPILSFGNSDGDQQMLEWTTAGDGARFAGIVRHTDAEREWAYDRDSHIGKLDKAMDEAHAKGWTLVDMKKDWKRIYRFEGAPAN